MSKNFITIVVFTLVLTGFNQEFGDKGILQIIALMFIGGFFTAFTPCVYPLIPVTIGIISEINKNYKRSSFFLSLIYALGIVFTYTSLGIVAGLGSFTFGNYMGNPIFVWILAMIFFILGLSMTGFYEIRLPEFITNRLVNIRGSSIISIFAMGLVAGFVAAPCTGPILASALVFISTGGSPLLGGIYLFSYALGLSIIFIIAGTFSGILKRMPRSGGWMVIIRSLFAIVIISYSIYLIDTIYQFSKIVNIYLSIALMITGLILGGLTSEVDFKPIKYKLIKLLGILMISIGIIGIFARSDVDENSIKWIKDYDEGMKLAIESKKPVIIDFYANWCAACKEIKNKTLVDKRIQRESERFVMIMIDATEPDEKISELEKRYRISGLPAIIFLDSNQNEVNRLRVTGFISADEFLRRMKEVR